MIFEINGTSGDNQKYLEFLQSKGWEVNEKDEDCFTIELETLEELLELQKLFGDSLILDENTIEIYDDHRE